MCLIAFAWQVDRRFPLVVAANRDEFHARPTRSAAFWDDAPQVLAGLDLVASGTWLGVRRDGSFCAVTNVRGAAPGTDASSSRGHLARDFLTGSEAAGACAARGVDQAGRYGGFNMLVCDGHELHWVSNHAPRSRRLEPGIYGLSNEALDTPWPKVERAKRELARVLEGGTDISALLALLEDTGDPQETGAEQRAGDSTGWMRSAVRIVSPQYGTRSSTAVLVGAEGLQFAERTFGADGSELDTVRYEFSRVARGPGGGASA